MISFHDSGFAQLASQVAFCLGNLRTQACPIEGAGRFYEEAAEALRAHAILRLLFDADGDGFSNDLAMSGQARRGWLRRCGREQYNDYFLALSRSGSMVDSIAGDAPHLAGEIFRQSPAAFRPGDEYQDDFAWQRFQGLLVTGAARPELEAALGALESATGGDGARPAVARALLGGDSEAFEDAFQLLLDERVERNAEDAARAEEDLVVAAGTQVYVQGVAVLKLARQTGIVTADEYPMCPTLALLPRPAPSPADEFSSG